VTSRPGEPDAWREEERHGPGTSARARVRGARSGGDVAAAQQHGPGEQGRGCVPGQHERARCLPEEAGAVGVASGAGGGGGQAAEAVLLDGGAEVGG
jgi:hypothetical protein